jgi:hypothetical protein
MKTSISVRTLCLVASGLLLAAAAGCGGGGKSYDSKIDANQIVGSWVEYQEPPSADPRVAKPPEIKLFRRITFNADGTFQMTLASKAGKAVEGAKVAGQWKNETRFISFEISENTLKGDDQRLAPDQCTGVIKNEAGEDITLIYGPDGWSGSFKRAN